MSPQASYRKEKERVIANEVASTSIFVPADTVQWTLLTNKPAPSLGTLAAIFSVLMKSSVVNLKFKVRSTYTWLTQ